MRCFDCDRASEAILCSGRGIHSEAALRPPFPSGVSFDEVMLSLRRGGVPIGQRSRSTFFDRSLVFSCKIEDSRSRKTEITCELEKRRRLAGSRVGQEASDTGRI